MKAPPNAELYQEMALRFEAVGRLFTKLGTPEHTKELLESIIRGDAGGFAKWTRELEIPVLGKCLWLRDLVEVTVSGPPTIITECWIRDDLTFEERILLWQIARRHRQFSVASGHGFGVAPPPIPAGPYLDELTANNLVRCETRTVSDTITTLVLGRPERVCV